MVEGDLCKFQPGARPAAFDLASIAEIKNEGSGYLRYGVFVVKLEMRLKEPENESSSYSSGSDVIGVNPFDRLGTLRPDVVCADR